MFNRFFSKQKQKGLSLIEASMVLVLSAVVVAGVMVYYQTAQNNNRLEKTAAQIMHLVSEINGLYAGVKDNGNGDGIYSGLSTQTLLSAVSDLESENVRGTTAIKTPIPDVFLVVTHELDKNYGRYNRFTIELASIKQGLISQICQKFVALNFGEQETQIMVASSSNNGVILPASSLFSDKLAACQKLDGSNGNVVIIYFK